MNHLKLLLIPLFILQVTALPLLVSPVNANTTYTSHYEEHLTCYLIGNEAYIHISLTGDSWNGINASQFPLSSNLTLWFVNGSADPHIQWTDLPRLPTGAILEINSGYNESTQIVSVFEDIFGITFIEITNWFTTGTTTSQNYYVYYAPIQFTGIVNTFFSLIPNDTATLDGFTNLLINKQTNYLTASFAMLGIKVVGGSNLITLDFVHKTTAGITSPASNSYAADLYQACNFTGVEIKSSSISSQSLIDIYVPAANITSAVVPQLNISSNGKLQGRLTNTPFPHVKVNYTYQLAYQPVIQLIKTVNATAGNPGDPINVTLIATNVGSGVAYDLNIIDSNWASWLESLAPGESWTSSNLTLIPSSPLHTIFTLPIANCTYSDSSRYNIYTSQSNQIILAVGSSMASIIPIYSLSSYVASPEVNITGNLILHNIGNADARHVTVTIRFESGLQQFGDNYFYYNDSIPANENATVPINFRNYGINPMYDFSQYTHIQYHNESVNDPSAPSLNVTNTLPGKCPIAYIPPVLDYTWFEIQKTARITSPADSEYRYKADVTLKLTQTGLMPSSLTPCKLNDHLPADSKYVAGNLTNSEWIWDPSTHEIQFAYTLLTNSPALGPAYISLKPAPGAITNQRYYSNGIKLYNELNSLTITYPQNGSTIKGDYLQVNGTYPRVHFKSINCNDTRFTILSTSDTSFSFINTTSIPDGVINLEINITDPAGNFGPLIGSASVSFTVDNTAPMLNIISPVNGSYVNSQNITVSWMGSDPNLDYYNITIDSGNWINAGTATNYDFTLLSENSHTARVMAVDKAGNTVERTVTFNVDVTPPTVAVSSPINGTHINSDNVTAIWSWSDTNFAYSNVLLDSGQWQNVGSSTAIMFTSLPEGTHTITIRAFDLANNFADSFVAFNIDLTPPIININYPIPNSIVHVDSGNYIWVNGSITEANKGSNQPTINDARFSLILWNSSSGSFCFRNNSAIIDGTNVLTVSFTDLAGNIGNGSISFTVDNTAPIAFVSYPSAGAIVHVSSGNYIWVNGSITEANKGSNQPTISDSHFSLALWNHASGEFSFCNNTAIPDGNLEVWVNFTDSAENKGSYSVSFTVENQVPPPPVTSNYTLYIIIGVAIAAAIAAFFIVRKYFVIEVVKAESEGDVSSEGEQQNPSENI
jgi:hypothetical protein